MAFKKGLIERALGAELGHHLGCPSGADKPESGTNQRNGKGGKTVAARPRWLFQAAADCQARAALHRL